MLQLVLAADCVGVPQVPGQAMHGDPAHQGILLAEHLGDVNAQAQLLAGLDALQKAFPDKPACVICGGELRSPVTGDGLGGRNQAFVLECVPRIAGKNIVVMSVGTDGIDGNSDAAGAVADGTTLKRAGELGLDPEEYAANSDSNAFFEALEDDIVTGPTGNNVRDIRVLLSWP